MDKKEFKIGKIIIAFLIVLGLGYGFICLLKLFIGYVESFINGLSNMDTVVIVALITGGVSIFSVVISSIVSKIIDYKQTTKRYLYEKKEEPYSEFIDMVYKIQHSSKDNEYSEEQMLKDISSFSKKLTLWGSNNVIKKWLDFRKISQKENNNPELNLFILEQIIFEIRKDMGQKSNGLERGDILAFFVNDIDKYINKDNNEY